MDSITLGIPFGDPYDVFCATREEIYSSAMRAMARTEAWQQPEWYKSGQIPLLDSLANLIRGLLDRLNPATWGQWIRALVVDPMVGWLREHLFDNLLLGAGLIKNSLLGWLSAAWSWLLGTLASIPGLIATALRELPGKIESTLHLVFGAIRASLDLWLGSLNRLVGMIPEPIRAGLRAAWETMKWCFESLWNVLGGIFNLNRTAMTTVIGSSAAFIQNPLEGLRSLWNTFMLTWPGQLFAAIGNSLLAFWNNIMVALRRFKEWILPTLMDLGEEALTTFRPWVEDLVGQVGTIPGTVLNFIAGTAGTDLALDPGRALTTLGGAYMIAMASGLAAHILSTALNAIPATNWVGASGLAAFVGEIAGFGPLTSASYGILVSEVLAIPLRYYWNAQLRPRLPGDAAIINIAKERRISYEEFSEVMAHLGYPNFWIRKIYDEMWEEPTPMWLLRATEAGIPRLGDPGAELGWCDSVIPTWRDDPDSWLRMNLIQLGYDDINVGPMIRGIKLRSLTSPLGAFKSAVKAMGREGYWLAGDVAAALAPWNVRAEEVALLIASEELGYQKDYLDDEVKNLCSAYQKETISEDQLSLGVSAFIPRPERVAQIVARERLKKMPKPTPPKAPKEDPAVTKLRQTLVDAYIAMFKKRLIKAMPLYQYLLAAGLSEPLARASATKEAALRIKTPPLDSPYFLSESLKLLIDEGVVALDDLYEDGTITIEEYLADLLGMGLDDATATYLADRAEFRQFIQALPTG